MAKNKIKIEEELATKVMFDADRICCICKERKPKTQIHHIDEDPSNNEYSNLALLCKDCHDEVHTKYPFSRKISSDEIRLFNDDWRAVIRSRRAHDGPDPLELEYQLHVLQGLAAVPHEWKVCYISLYPGNFNNTGYSSAVHGGDAWNMMAEKLSHNYSIAEWEKYRSLFSEQINNLIDQINGTLIAHGSVIPIKIKLAISRLLGGLRNSKGLYTAIPKILESVDVSNHREFFETQFKFIIQILSSFASLVNDERGTIISQH